MRRIICPICKGESRWEDNLFRPFCSKACQERDLGNWATEKYRVPTEHSPEEFSDDSEEQSDESKED